MMITENSKEVLQDACSQARGLAMDAIAQCKSGHLGLPLGAAEVGAVLFGSILSMNPDEPTWMNRDRFILSGGHGSMFLYSWLHLSGYDISREDLKNFRKLHSKTAGHPEFGYAPGIESTTGPLGQGVGNAVGMAIAEKMMVAKFNTQEHPIFGHHVIALAGDGCLQEGVAAEASSLAGHLGLDNLILIYDSNDVTLDAAASKSQSEDVAARYRAYGFDVVTIDGHDLSLVEKTLLEAKANKNGKPKLIEVKTIIGQGIAQVAGTNKAHGEAGVAFVAEAKQSLGLPEEGFFVSEAVQSFFKAKKEDRKEAHQVWSKKYDAWKKQNPDLAKTLETAGSCCSTDELMAAIPEFDTSKNLASRAAGELALNALAQKCPLVISGSADLHGSTKNYIKDAGDFSREEPSGRNLYFGIREHAMGAIVNGFGYHGVFRASCATFLTFSDYMRPSVRLAALAKLPVFYIWTHDSIGVGEDGPTHQPVEHVSALRLIPNLDIIRPGDSEETAGAYVAALERNDGPTGLILSRQSLAIQSDISVEQRRSGVLKGAYVAHKETTELELIIMASGSELQHAMAAVKQLGSGVRVVSMPCMERFERQEPSYKEQILPISCKKRIAMEAGVPHLWQKYVGDAGKVIGVSDFGLSAPGSQVMEAFGITEDALLKEAKNYS